jgi:protein TonB
MEPNKIQDADILDIIFEGRNKDYGAYELRKTYNSRIVKSMIVMGSVVALLVIGNVVSGFGKKSQLPKPDVTDITLDNVKEDVKPPVIPPPVIKAPPVAMKQFTPPLIVKTDVPKDERPPENDELDKVKIGPVNVTGTADDGTDVPVATGDGGKGIAEAPKKADDDNDGRPWTKVEIDASFPGGPAAWLRFLNKNLRSPDEAINNGISGKVVVQFIVDKDGNVSDVVAISGPEQGGLREEAVRVIKKSGKWTPAIQNGRYVKAYRVQPVIFQIGE